MKDWLKAKQTQEEFAVLQTESLSLHRQNAQDAAHPEA
jgi:hypothetical protein